MWTLLKTKVVSIVEAFIKRILEIDKQAKTMTLDKDELIRKTDLEVDEIVAKISEESKNETKKIIELFNKSEIKNGDKKLAKKEEEYNEILAKFDESFKANRENWANEIVNRIITNN